MHRTAPLLLLLAGCGLGSGDFPSLKPRAGEAPRVTDQPAPPADLSAEERAGLAADIARESAALDAIQRDIDAAGAELGKTLTTFRGAPRGSDGWSAAQMALSRYDLARAPLGDLDARLAPLFRTVDSLPADHPDRQAVESLAAAVARANADAARTAEAATQALDR